MFEPVRGQSRANRERNKHSLGDSIDRAPESERRTDVPFYHNIFIW